MNEAGKCLRADFRMETKRCEIPDKSREPVPIVTLRLKIAAHLPGPAARPADPVARSGDEFC
jgi:hypothetical protein